MTTWRRGRAVLSGRLRKGHVPIDVFLRDLGDEPRVPGTAVYLTSLAGFIPPALFANLRHNNALHETVLLVNVMVARPAHVAPAARAVIDVRSKGFVTVTLRYGYRDRTDVPLDLRDHVAARVDADFDDLTYVVGREHILIGQSLPRWRSRLFASLARNAADVSMTFSLPPDRVFEIGVPVKL